MITSTHQGGVQIRYTPLGIAEVVVAGTPVALPSIPTEDKVRRVVIRVLDADIVYTDDGTDPSASHGIPIKADEILVYDGNQLTNFKMIRRAGVSADVRVAYYGN